MYCAHCFSESPNTSPRCIQCGKAFFDTNESAKPETKAEQGNVVPRFAWLASIFVGWYLGIYLLLLIVCSFAIWWTGKKFLTLPATVYLKAIAIQGGQLLMIGSLIVALSIFAPDSLQLSAFETLLMAVSGIAISVGLIWLIQKPGLKPIMFLSVLQVCLLVWNTLGLFYMPLETTLFKSTSSHVLWRILALIAMWKPMWATRFL